jgi:serine O-acetyltransferase
VRNLWQLPVAVAARTSRIWPAVERDVQRFVQPRLDLPLASVGARELLSACAHRPFRTVLYTRMRVSGLRGRAVQRVLRSLYRGQILLEVEADEIGPGVFMWHGYATVVHAVRIGVDCQFGHLVTVGFSDKGGPPTLGDRVRIAPGAMVLGPVTIGDDAVVGANAIVVTDVAPATVVGGVPARPLLGAADVFSATKARSHEGG